MGSYTTKRKLYKPSIGETGWGAKINQNFDILDDHKHVRDDITDFAHTHVRDDITDLLPVKRSDLEYPTEYVVFGYLAIIDKLLYGAKEIYGGVVVTLDSFTDKAVEGVMQPYNVPEMVARLQDRNNMYWNEINLEKTTEDHLLFITSAGTRTILATEAIDLDKRGEIFCISCSGSTIKSLRYEIETPTKSIVDVTPTAIISATDTTFASGLFGIRPIADGYPHGFIDTVTTRLLPSQTDLPQPSAIVEYDVVGDGSKDNPYRPDMPKDLVEVSKDQVTPVEWLALQSNPKGANGLPLVDRLSVAWGAIDYKGEPTMLCAIYGGSPSYLDPNRIKRHIDDARAKGRKVFKPPANVSEAKGLYREIKRDFPDKLITENELAYQLIGLPELEVDAVADFYEREILNLNRIKRVPTWELDRTLKRWEDLARKHNRLEALNKIRRCRKK